jgi:hypothetical protein
MPFLLVKERFASIEGEQRIARNTFGKHKYSLAVHIPVLVGLSALYP